MLINCHECDAPVSTEAKACMRCGAPPRFPKRSDGTPVTVIPPATQKPCPPGVSSKEVSSAEVPLRFPKRSDGTPVNVIPPATQKPCPPVGGSKEDSPAEVPLRFPKRAKKVSFADVRYEINCPTCHEKGFICGRTLASQDFVSCPSLGGCGSRLSIKSLKLTPVAGEKIAYRRIADYFSYSGRISVGTYWLSFLLVLPVLFAARLIHPFLYGFLFLILLLPLWVKRYHDLGLGGGWAMVQVTASLLGLVVSIVMPSVINEIQSYPLLGFAYAISLLMAIPLGIYINFFAGEELLNRYGPPPSDVEVTWL